jgi:threonine/homoserine/homoserine lactone efflux protein
MDGVHDLALFVPAALLLNLTPGADMLFVAGTAGARGRRAGVLAALGVGVGCFVHIALAALGLSALLAASELAFTAVKLVGAAYLVWMGLGLLRATPPDAQAQAPAHSSGAPARTRSVFWQGALTNALNPKVALFFLAFLPQFVDGAGPARAAAFVVLGVLFTIGGTLVNVAVALAAGSLARGLAGRGRMGTWLQRAAGALFVGLGLRLAFGGR